MEAATKQTPAWMIQCWISFGLSAGMTLYGVWQIPVDSWIQAYLFMGMVFTIGSCFNLAKALRDEHENKRLINRISDARTEKILREFESVN